MAAKVMFSSEKEDWGTPQQLFDELNKEFNFVLEAAASKENTKCDNYITKELNALDQAWEISAQALGGDVFLNPPYSRRMSPWIKKAFQTAAKGTTVVCLIPSRTDTKYWHSYIWNDLFHRPYKGVEVRFIKGRLKFGESKNSAPFPSVVVVFRGKK